MNFSTKIFRNILIVVLELILLAKYYILVKFKETKY